MNICYLILAHNEPEMLKRSLGKLSGKDSYFYIHIDKKADITPFKEALRNTGNVRFIADEKRVEATWGTSKTLDAVVACMKAASEEHSEGYSLLMSGTDYPIRSNEYIREFITAHADTIFTDAQKMPVPQWHKGGFDRISRHWFNLGGRKFAYINPYRMNSDQLRNFLTILKVRPSLLPQAAGLWFVKRRLPIDGFVHYGGSLWFGAPLFSVKTLLNYLDEHPEYLTFHKRSKMADEIAFNSLLMLDKRARIVTDTALRFIEWDYTKPEQPTTFTAADKPALSEAMKIKENLLARKFSLERDKEILDWIDNKL